MRVRPIQLLTLLGFALTSSACAQDLPDPRTIETVRTLAVRVDVTVPLDPKEPEDVGERCQALPFETVRLTPFVVDPTGPIDAADIEPIWILCQLNPVQGLFGCISDAFPTSLDEIEDCVPPDFTDLDSGELPEAQSPCRLPDGPSPEFVAPLNSSVLVGGDLEITMVGSAPGGPSSESCANTLLSGDHEVPDDCIIGVQRVELGPLEHLILLAEDFGLDLGDFEPPDPSEIPDFDRNPRLSRFEVATVKADGTPGPLVPVERGETIKAKLGDTLRIETSVPEQDLQTFLQPLNDLETEEDVETIDGDYFRTFGTLLAGSIDDTEAYTEWTLEPEKADDPERPPDDRATIFLTLRDNRIGVDWWWFHVDVSE